MPCRAVTLYTGTSSPSVIIVRAGVVVEDSRPVLEIEVLVGTPAGASTVFKPR